MIPVASRLDLVHSDIRGPLYQEALRMEAAGTQVLKLNTGNPGRFGFDMPPSVRGALLSQADEAVPYCDVRGMKEARIAIRNYHLSRGVNVRSIDDVYICNGVSEAAGMLMAALVGVGEEILVPTPCYSLWSNNACLYGAAPVFYRCAPENAWAPDTGDIRSKITEKTRAILLINPNNPTGAVYSDEVLREVADIAREHSLAVVSDEIYDRLTLDDLPVTSFGSIAPDVPTVTLNGLSKSHIVCGFRCGWMAFSGPEGAWDKVQQGVMKMAAMRLCGNALTQLVIPAAMADDESTKAMLLPGTGRLYEQRRAVTEVLDTIPGVHYEPNHAAFYLFPGIDSAMYDFLDDQDFAMQFLHEEHVLVIPGRGFEWPPKVGASAPTSVVNACIDNAKPTADLSVRRGPDEGIYFRIVMLPEPETLRQAMLKLKDFLARHRK